MDELTQITQHLLRFSPDALIVVDENGRICFANETVSHVLGHAPGALFGRSIEVLIPERLRGPHGRHLAGYVRNPANRDMGARIANLFAVRADGSEFAAGIRLAPFTIGGKLFVAAAVRDNTERHKINDELVAAREEADRANRAKSRFLATASHDLRQPMQTIQLLNAAMLKALPQPEAHELLEQQQHAIESITRLLNALLDISRLESGAIEPTCADVRLTEVLDGLHTEFEPLAVSRGLALTIDPSALVVRTDRTLLQQLLQNLVANAIKYTDRGSVRVRISLDAAALVITVDDTGIGIPADKLERIFDEYYQVDTHGTKRLGVGLGLAIVKEVARLLHFSVRVTSQVGVGTQAKVSIPREFLAAGRVSTEAAVEAAPVSVPVRKSRLLLIEDNDGVRVATELFLKLEGFETLSAGSVADAQKLFNRMQEGDIVIADYHLDTKNTGLNLLLDLRARLGREVPAVILSGDLPAMLRVVKSPIPSCRFLGKPVDTAALLGAIAELGGGPG